MRGFIMTRKISNKIIYLSSPLFFLLLWYLLAAIIDAPLILPFPHAVILRLFAMAQTLLFWKSFCFTFFRVIISFIISVTAGLITGFLSANIKAVKAFLSFPFAVIRATPIAALILLALFWFKSDEVPVFAAFLMALPVMNDASEKGFSITSELQQKIFMARSYGLKDLKIFRFIIIPHAMPAVLSALESVSGICWKVVVAGEILSVPKAAYGSMLQKAQVHLETADVLAITLMVVLSSMLLQNLLKLVVKNIKRHYN